MKNNNNDTDIHIPDTWKAIKASLDEKREQMQQKLKSQMEASKKEFEIQTKRLAGKAVAMRNLLFFFFCEQKKFVEFFSQRLALSIRQRRRLIKIFLVEFLFFSQRLALGM